MEQERRSRVLQNKMEEELRRTRDEREEDIQRASYTRSHNPERNWYTLGDKRRAYYPKRCSPEQNSYAYKHWCQSVKPQHERKFPIAHSTMILIMKLSTAMLSEPVELLPTLILLTSLVANEHF